MKRRSIPDRLLPAAVLAVCTLAALLAGAASRPQRLVACDQETGALYGSVTISAGDAVEFDWTHSFEHIPWNEYYTVQKDGSFLLDTISVAGFGAGIPAEMDVTYRYADGVIYMEGIGSRFEDFRFFNSETALREIKVNGTHFLSGTEMPHHAKVCVRIE